MNNRRRVRNLLKRQEKGGGSNTKTRAAGKNPITGRLLPGYRYAKGGKIVSVDGG